MLLLYSILRYALDAADHTSFSQLLPIPPASTAYLLPPERFKFLSIPCKSEYLPAAVSLSEWRVRKRERERDREESRIGEGERERGIERSRE